MPKPTPARTQNFKKDNNILAVILRIAKKQKAGNADKEDRLKADQFLKNCNIK